MEILGKAVEAWTGGWVGVRSRSPSGEAVVRPPRKVVEAPPCWPQDLQALASSFGASLYPPPSRTCFENWGPPWGLVGIKSGSAK